MSDRGNSLDFTQDELRRLIAVLDAPDDLGFEELAKTGQVDPAKGFRSADLRGIDFGTSDLAGFNFSGANLDRCNLSGVRNLDKVYFDGKTSFEDTKLPEGVTIEMLRGQGYLPDQE